MSCQANPRRSARASGRSGITASNSLICQALANRRPKEIFIRPDLKTATGYPPPLLIQMGREGEDFLYGDAVEIEGPARVVHFRDRRPGKKTTVLWVETSAPVRVLSQSERTTSRRLSPLQSRREQAAGRSIRAQNVRQVYEAIRQKRKIRVTYETAQGGRLFTLIPLDIKGGRTGATRKNRYLWACDEQAQQVISLRLDRVKRVSPTAETFDPGAVTAQWVNRQPRWNLPRDW